MPRFFDLAVLDEGHEYKARGSAQGLAAEALADACGKTLTLTGTIFGGYSSTLFYLLWRFSPAVRREFSYRDEAKWISRFGVVERNLNIRAASLFPVLGAGVINHYSPH